MSTAPGDPETRERLLEAAERLFAERGFNQVTVREICAEASANVAAVNYHFGDKLGLYREVLHVAIGAIREATETARQAGEGMTPEEQLRRYIGLLLHRLLSPGHRHLHRLINREMTDPTPVLDELVEQALRPRLDYLAGVIAGIIGCRPSDRRVIRCVLSVQSQSIMYARPNAIAERLGFTVRPNAAQLDEMAAHIAAFSIGGVRAVGGVADRGAREAPRRAT